MAVNPHNKQVELDPVHFTGDRKDSVSIMTYHSGFLARLPAIPTGLCGRDLRGLASSLLKAADRVEELNRQYETGAINEHGFSYFDTEEILIKAL